MTNDSDLRRRYVLALDEALPPAPALGARVSEVLRREQRSRDRRSAPMFWRLGSGLRLSAGMGALIVGILAASTLLLTGRSLISPATSHGAHPYRFVPTTTAPAADWPQGGLVPSSLAGCWQLQTRAGDEHHELCLGQYSFDIGQGSSIGNVVVNGDEVIFFRSDICAMNMNRPGDRYLFVVAGGKLSLVNVDKLVARGPALVNTDPACGWELDGTYLKVATQ